LYYISNELLQILIFNLSDNEKTLSDFGTAFIAAWKNTHNYRVWNSNKHPALAEVNSR